MLRQEAMRDFIIGLCVITVAIIYWIIMLFEVNSVNDSTGMGGRQMSILVASLTLISGIVLSISSLHKLRTLQYEEEKKNDEEKTTIIQVKRVLLYLLIIALYGVGFAYIGFLVSSFACLIILMYFNGAKSHKIIILTAAIAPVITWIIFYYVAETPMPETWFI